MGVNGDIIHYWFSTKYLGDVGCLIGELYETEFFLNEPDYNMMMILTFSGLAVPKGQK